jgi:hypothetical protein
MLIRILIDSTQPLAGTAATEEAEPLHFDGWLELLRVISELVAATASSGARTRSHDEHNQRRYRS